MSLFFKNLPNIEARMKWQWFMRIFLGMKPENDCHYALFEVFRTMILFVFLSWLAITLYFYISPNEKIIIADHLSTFWAFSGTIINFIIVPYYILKSVKIFGFQKYDFLEAWGFRKNRYLWEKEKIVVTYFIIILIAFIGLQFGWIKSYLILDRYNINNFYSYIFPSFLIGFIIAGTGTGLYYITLIFIQYKFHFEKIPNLELHRKNREGDFS